jgi:hypothetical protein
MFNAHADDFSEFLVDPDEDMLGSMEIPSFIQPVSKFLQSLLDFRHYKEARVDLTERII